MSIDSIDSVASVVGNISAEDDVYSMSADSIGGDYVTNTSFDSVTSMVSSVVKVVIVGPSSCVVQYSHTTLDTSLRYLSFPF